MAVVYKCECRDGRTVTGSSKWELAALKQMGPQELAKILDELAEFARYYDSNFHYPIRSMNAEIRKLEENYARQKRIAAYCGIATVAFTLLWIILAIVPSVRFSGLTLAMALLTFLSILFFIPIIFRFAAAQEDCRKRLPKVRAKLDSLLQKQEQEIFGAYLDYLIGGHIVSPEYSLSSDALEWMAQLLRTRRASNMSEAAVLCKKKYPHSPVPRIIQSLHSVSGSGEPKSVKKSETPKASTVNLNKMQTQGPDLRSVVQLAEYLNAAVKSYAANQRSTAPSDGEAMALTVEEEALLQEFRELSPDEQRRIRRVVHSFFTKKY